VAERSAMALADPSRAERSRQKTEGKQEKDGKGWG
jgi:hypothetical protein